MGLESPKGRRRWSIEVEDCDAPFLGVVLFIGAVDQGRPGWIPGSGEEAAIKARLGSRTNGTLDRSYQSSSEEGLLLTIAVTS